MQTTSPSIPISASALEERIGWLSTIAQRPSASVTGERGEFPGSQPMKRRAERLSASVTGDAGDRDEVFFFFVGS